MRCFIKACAAEASPRVWLRVAEGTVAAYRQRVAVLRREHQVTPAVHRRFQLQNKVVCLLPLSDRQLASCYEGRGLGFAELATQKAMAAGTQATRVRAVLNAMFVAVEQGRFRQAVELMKQVPAADAVKPGAVNLNEIRHLAPAYRSQAHLGLREWSSATNGLGRMALEASLSSQNPHAAMLFHTVARAYSGVGDGDNASKFTNKLDSDKERPEVILMRAGAELSSKRPARALDLLLQSKWGGT